MKRSLLAILGLALLPTLACKAVLPEASGFRSEQRAADVVPDVGTLGDADDTVDVEPDTTLDALVVADPGPEVDTVVVVDAGAEADAAPPPDVALDIEPDLPPDTGPDADDAADVDVALDVDVGLDTAIDPCVGQNCDDADPCTVDTCESGSCKHVLTASGAAEICNGKDDNCNGITDADSPDVKTWFYDGDGDGYGASASQIHCGATGKYTASKAGDCDDANNAIHPGAYESCNGIDDNCNGLTDADSPDVKTWYYDGDLDGYGTSASQINCGASGKYTTKTTGDCNDADNAVHPGAYEACNGVDDNCNGITDNDSPDAKTYYADLDKDAWGNPAMASKLCFPSGVYKELQAGDCDDNNLKVHPGATEVCNGVDDDCAGGIDNGVNCDDGKACTTDSCGGLGGCAHANVGAGTSCSGGGTCDGAGACSSTTPAGMALIPAGTFWMGCNTSKDPNCGSQASENPQHKVTLSAYYMDLTETTVVQYKACVDAGICTVPSAVQPTQYATYPSLANNPVNFVSWTQSQQYCQWRGPGFDLPTEAQWEMAARGSCETNGSTAGDAACAKAMRTYPWGEAPADCSYAVMTNGTYGCGTDMTWAVGSKPAGDSPYGLHDMAGNVWEWSRDWYESPYSGGDQTDPVGPGSSAYRVARGGDFRLAAGVLRASARPAVTPNGAGGAGGLRCTRPVDLCAASCDDANACTTDTCDPQKGCQHTAVGAGTACTGGACDAAGKCVAGVPAGMAQIPAGTFWMGCNSSKDAACSTKPNESPQHKVTLSAYYMDVTETTVAQYKKCVDAGKCPAPSSQSPTPYATYPDLPDNPVNFVNWTQSQQYCQWRGAGFDLPTEAQWEMAARGSCEKNGSSAADDTGCKAAMRTYPWGEDAASCLNAVMTNGTSGCGTNATWAVGSKTAGDSPYGLHNMAGNVWEWTRDYWAGAYVSGDQTNPLGSSAGTYRMTRGGSFDNDAIAVRAGFRNYDTAAATYGGFGSLGFRCARPVDLCADVTCDDANACTTDTCDPAKGCQHTAVGAGTACTGGACDAAGKCVAAVPAGMALIPAGTFWMGCNTSKDANCGGQGSENPQHKVTLSAYYMDVAETTAGQYKKCVDAGVCTAPGSVQPTVWATYPGLTNNPINFVSWSQSQQYCQWRGAGYDLPTDAQWEMGARGSCEMNGSSAGDAACAQAMRTYPWGELTATCSYAVMYSAGYGCGKNATWAVGSLPAGDSPYGLHDMAGNVWEWVRDWWPSPYTSGEQVDPMGPGSGSFRIRRGGGFYSGAVDQRASGRASDTATGDSNAIGFRCARPVDLCAASCDDGNACTTDTCDPAKGCQHSNLPDWSPCGEGMVCDGKGACGDVKGSKGMAYIPAGTFWMGCNAAKDGLCNSYNAEKPQHKVILSTYYMDVTETTAGQYKACVDAGVCTVPGLVLPGQVDATYPTATNNPINFVTWTQARQFCQWRGGGFDLPTEAQWEMAARGSCEKNGSTAGNAACAQAMRTYPWGETAPNCTLTVWDSGGNGCGTNATWPVGSKPAGDSPYGLHDMAGNVWEWTRDWYAGYAAGDQTDPLGPGSASQRADRGGGFAYWGADSLRTSNRASLAASAFYVDLGLRCSRTYP